MEMYLNIGKIFLIILFNRDQLTANIQKNFNGLIVDFEDIDSENKNLAEYLVKQPGQILYLVRIIFNWR
jgi:hypothetical protein